MYSRKEMEGMKMARELTSKEIEELASQKGVKRIAVENFLSSIPLDCSQRDHLGNLQMDARLYRWNQATVNAITRGIKKAYDYPTTENN